MMTGALDYQSSIYCLRCLKYLSFSLISITGGAPTDTNEGQPYIRRDSVTHTPLCNGNDLKDQIASNYPRQETAFYLNLSHSQQFKLMLPRTISTFLADADFSILSNYKEIII